MPRLTLVIPMYNESPRLENGVRPILDHLSRLYPDTQVVLVDDGSSDGTADKAASLLGAYPGLRKELVRLGRTGKGGAVKAGMARAVGEIRAFADSDNATPIEEIDRLLPLVENDRTIVIGSRAIDPALLECRQPWWRETMGKSFNRFLRLCVGLPYRDTQCGFKLFGKVAAERCFSRQRLDGFAFDVELLWIARTEGFPVREIPVRWRHVHDSRVRPVLHSLEMARDVLRIRLFR